MQSVLKTKLSTTVILVKRLSNVVASMYHKLLGPKLVLAFTVKKLSIFPNVLATFSIRKHASEFLTR